MRPSSSILARASSAVAVGARTPTATLPSSSMRTSLAFSARSRPQMLLLSSPGRAGPLPRSTTGGNAIPSARRHLFTRSAPPSPLRTARSWLTSTLLVVGGVFFVAYYLDSRSAIHRWVAIPLLKASLDPEAAQKLAIDMLASGIAPQDLHEELDEHWLATELFGKPLKNPIGLAAGFDKQGQAIDGLFKLGFGIVEVGSVTPEPQPGNPKPRYFRLNADNAAINRFGFNSDGHTAVLGRLRDRVRRWLLHESAASDLRLTTGDSKAAAEKLLASHPDSGPQLVEAGGLPRSLHAGKLLSINLGKNKTSAEQDVSDYVKGVHRLGPYADMIVVNVSSPNTPGLRRLQRKGVLSDLLTQVVQARDEMLSTSGLGGSDGGKKQGEGNDAKKRVVGAPTIPLLVKIAPDLDEAQLHDVADAVRESGVDGIIISNTTIQRPASLVSTAHIGEAGGLSGPPLKPLSIKALTTVRERVGPELTIIGCGGIYTAQDALDFAKAGASAVQLYTSFGYEGVGHPRRLKDELIELLKREGKTWKEVVGSGVKLEDVRETKAKSHVEMEELYRRNVAGIKAELEGLRASWGGAAEALSSETPQQPARAQLTNEAADRSTARTATPFFRPDPNDADYVTLLRNAHKALGTKPVWEEGQQAGQAEERKRAPTKGEQVKGALDAALRDTKVSPQAAVQGSGAVEAGTAPISGKLAEAGNGAEKKNKAAEEDSKKKDSSSSSGKGWGIGSLFGGKGGDSKSSSDNSSSATSGKSSSGSSSGSSTSSKPKISTPGDDTRKRNLVDIDGPRPDFKAVDKRRVV